MSNNDLSHIGEKLNEIHPTTPINLVSRTEEPTEELAKRFLASKSFSWADYYELIRRSRGAVWSPDEMALWNTKFAYLRRYYESLHWWDESVYSLPTVEMLASGYPDALIKHQARGVRGLIGIEKDYSLGTWYVAVSAANRGPLETQQLSAPINNFISGMFRNLFIYSTTPGTGKTGLAISIAKEIQKRDPELIAEIIRMPELSLATYENRQALLDRIQKGIYILDDIHRFKTSTGFGSDYLWAMINRLMMKSCRIIVTSNLHLAGLQGKVGEDSEATLDRLREGGLFDLELSGFSLRK